MTLQNFKAVYFLGWKMSQKHRKWWHYFKRHVWGFENAKKYQIWIFEENQTKKICFLINVIDVKTYYFPGLTWSREVSLNDAEGQTDQYYWYQRSKHPVAHVSHECSNLRLLITVIICDGAWTLKEFGTTYLSGINSPCQSFESIRVMTQQLLQDSNHFKSPLE